MSRKLMPATGALQIGDVLLSTNSSLSTKTWVRANGSFYNYANYPQYWTFKNPSYAGQPYVLSNGTTIMPTDKMRISGLTSAAFLRCRVVNASYPNYNTLLEVVSESSGTVLHTRIADENAGNDSAKYYPNWGDWDPKNQVLYSRLSGNYENGRFACFKTYWNGSSWSTGKQTTSVDHYYDSVTHRFFRNPNNLDALVIVQGDWGYPKSGGDFGKFLGVSCFNPSGSGTFSEYNTYVADGSGSKYQMSLGATMYFDSVTSLYYVRADAVDSGVVAQTIWVRVNSDSTVTQATPPDIGRLTDVSSQNTPLFYNLTRIDHLSLAYANNPVVDYLNNRYFDLTGSLAKCYQLGTNTPLPTYDRDVFGLDSVSDRTVWYGTEAGGYLIRQQDGTSTSNIYVAVNKNTQPQFITFSVPNLSFSGVTTYVKAAG